MQLQKETLKVFGLFLLWRAGLFTVAFLATIIIPVFGGRFPYYDNLLIPTGLPSWIWGFGNFDGVHYLRIALMGYEGSHYSQAFFPLYPLIIKILSLGDFPFWTGFILSNILFLASLHLFYKLLSIDHSPKVSLQAVVLLLVFPTSFYFGSLYSESLFLLLSLSSLIFIRKKNFLLAGIFAALASATRIVGIFLFAAIIIECFLLWKRGELKNLWSSATGILIAPMGLFAYIFYLKSNFNNPFYFLSAQPVFGAERSESIILLPQVIFRYLKMMTSLQINSLSFFNVSLELILTLIPLALLIASYKKIRLSYWVFTLGCLLLPTLTGTLSSMPRYALMSFLVFPFIAERTGRYFNGLVLLLAILGIFLLSLFTRGYWVA